MARDQSGASRDLLPAAISKNGRAVSHIQMAACCDFFRIPAYCCCAHSGPGFDFPVDAFDCCISLAGTGQRNQRWTSDRPGPVQVSDCDSHGVDASHLAAIPPYIRICCDCVPCHISIVVGRRPCGICGIRPDLDYHGGGLSA